MGGPALLLGLVALIGFWLVRRFQQARVFRRATTAGDTPDRKVLRRRDFAIGDLSRLTAIIVFLAFGLLFGGQTSEDTPPTTHLWPIAGIVVALAVMTMERWWPSPAGTIRIASIEPRRVRLPRAGLVLALTGTVTGLWAMFQWPPTHGPSASLTAVTLTLLVLTVTAGIRQLIDRTALTTQDPALDLACRRAGIDRLLRLLAATGLLTYLDFNGVAGAAANLQPGATATGWSTAATVLLLVVVEGYRVRLPRATRPSAVPA
ncbi:hypothetical protein D1871_14635 [Nakamurella silvestris]|nr:hypothetical protein D1871_14635 [Nakamurella silvestris]